MQPPLKTGPEPSRDGPVIILGTGSRRWLDVPTVKQALFEAFFACTPLDGTPRTHPLKAATVRHGAAVKGLDKIIDREARALGMQVKKYDAKWGAPCDPDFCNHGPRVERYDGSTYCQAAGIRRNDHMVSLEPPATLVLAFLVGNSQTSPGTYDCATRAQLAGLPVWWFEA